MIELCFSTLCGSEEECFVCVSECILLSGFGFVHCATTEHG